MNCLDTKQEVEMKSQGMQLSGSGASMRLGAALAIIFVGASGKLRAEAQNAPQPRTVEALYWLAGQPMGSYTERREVESDGNVLTTIKSDMVFNRLEKKLEQKNTSRYRENTGGQLLTVDSESS